MAPGFDVGDIIDGFEVVGTAVAVATIVCPIVVGLTVVGLTERVPGITPGDTLLGSNDTDTIVGE